MMAASANELMALRYARIGGDEPVFFESEAQLAAAADIDADEIEFLVAGGGLEALFFGQYSATTRKATNGRITRRTDLRGRNSCRTG
jgi:hypothetical protein